MYEAKKLGQILLEEGMISEEQLEKAIEEQTKSNDSLGSILVKLGYITDDVLYHFLAMQSGVRFVDVGILTLPEDVVSIIKGETARKYKLLPIEKKPGRIVMASTNPPDPSVTSSLKYEIAGGQKNDVSFVMTTETALNETIEKYYPLANKYDEAMKDIESADNLEIEILEEKKQKDEEGDDGNIEGADSPIVKYVNFIIEDAVNKEASDIHLNLYEKKIVLRFRIDGALVELPPPPLHFKRALVSRLKLIAGMNIIERRLPQDGRIHYKLSEEKAIDLRVSTLPSIWGENIVMRLLYSETQNLDLLRLGFSDTQMTGLMKGLEAAYGMVLITGPTGSGKSTTLYSAISKINDPHYNIMTAEDPVEYRLPHLVQVQINNVANLTFPNVLRAFLRQDPDIILVGEIRDNETASISVKAALTGHLVLSTLHTNDAPSTITRLIDMEIDPIYVGSSVVTVISQKLVRKVCYNCAKELREFDYVKAKKAGIPAEVLAGGKFMEGEGCTVCHGTGYKGRCAAYEVMPINTAIRDLIFKRGTLNDLKRLVWKQGLVTVRESAIELMKKGITTLDEVIRETLQDKPLEEFYAKKK
jgi:type IV pilus assembly protein PilB